MFDPKQIQYRREKLPSGDRVLHGTYRVQHCAFAVPGFPIDPRAMIASAIWFELYGPLVQLVDEMSAPARQLDTSAVGSAGPHLAGLVRQLREMLKPPEGVAGDLGDFLPDLPAETADPVHH